MNRKLVSKICLIAVLLCNIAGCATHNPPPCDEFASAGNANCGPMVPINVAWK